MPRLLKILILNPLEYKPRKARLHPLGALLIDALLAYQKKKMYIKIVFPFTSTILASQDTKSSCGL